MKPGLTKAIEEKAKQVADTFAKGFKEGWGDKDAERNRRPRRRQLDRRGIAECKNVNAQQQEHVARRAL